MTSDLAAIAPHPALRAAINLGNRALARRDGDALHGVSPALARRLADEIGKPVEFVIYDGAGKTFADAMAGVWDVAFLAIDAKRAEAVSFTRPYKEIVATCAVRDNSPLTAVDEIDVPGTRILVGRGSAYDLHLTATLRHAELIRAADPGASFEQFRAGEADVVGGVLQSLQRAFPDGGGIRILPGRITTVRQAMVLPGHDPAWIAALDDFVGRALAEGFVDTHS
jgi:polar amino acid transport system substrate-binding protein